VNSTYVAVFVLVDILVTLAVVRFEIARRGGAAAVFGKLRTLAALAPELERETKAWLAANWNGDASTLPAVVEPLLARLESDVRARGVDLGRAELKPFVEQVVLRQGAARAGDVREAMKQVA
jgi:hypothetical protein